MGTAAKIDRRAAKKKPAAAAPGYTAQQEAAIATRDVSIALAAGAGCGKTFVLTERFLAALDPANHKGPPPELDELIAFTFTERAAREMRDRVRRKCAERLRDAPERDVPYWTALLRGLDAARIHTIHGFCSALLRAHAVEAQLDPSFAVLEQTPAGALLAEASDHVLRNRLSESHEPTLNLVVLYGLEGLEGMVGELLGERQCIDFAAWAARTPADLAQLWCDYHRRVAIPAALRRLIESPAVKTVDRIFADLPTGCATMAGRQAQWRGVFPNLADSGHPADNLAQLREAAKVVGSSGKKWTDECDHTEFKEAAESVRKQIDKLLPQLTFDVVAAQPVAALGLDLLSLVQDVLTKYDELKTAQGKLDFDDLLIHAHRLFTAEANHSLRTGLSKQLHLLLVDEFQDTNPLQVELVKALCGDELQTGKLFFVGDFKQSIYRFLGADPSVFRALQHEVPTQGRLPLTLNFRSQPAILQFVNAVFAEAFASSAATASEPGGESFAPLMPHRPQATSTPAVEWLWSSVAPDSPDVKKLSTTETRQREATAIARRLRAMLADKEQIVVDHLTQQPRPVRSGDIAILFRALSNVQLYEQALQQAGLDYYLVGGHAFYAQQEVFDLLNLLRAVASTIDEVALAGVLRSPLFALSDETLFWLTRDLSLPGGLRQGSLPPQIEAEQAARVRFAADTLERLRALKDRLPVAELINEALRLTGYDAVLLGEFLGERKLANLRKLIGQARSIDRAGLTLDEFIVQLLQYVTEQPHEPLAATHPESTDVIRLMTVHQAKGLEFPVVVVADVDRRSHGGGSRAVFTRELGPLVRLPVEGSDKSPLCGLDLHQMAVGDEERHESVRLFYVAATRAADYLILSSALDPQKPQGVWSRVLGERFDLENGRLAATLPADWPPPAVKVTRGEDLPPGEAEEAKHVNIVKALGEADAAAVAGKGVVAATVAPCQPDFAARRRFSFSRLSAGLKAKPLPSDDEPRGVEEQRASPGIDALSFGKLVHEVLERLDFSQPGDLPSRIERAAQRLALADPRLLPEARTMIERFFASPRCADIRAAAEVHRELEFMLAWPPDAAAADGPFLQGYIDCLYRDDSGRLRLLDFKTNRVTAQNLAETAANYALQMRVYALAVETVLGEAPASLTLHFLRGGLEYEFPWDDAARRGLRTDVDAAIAKAIADERQRHAAVGGGVV